MTDVAGLIRDLIAAGTDGELVGRVAAALSEREAVLVPDEAAERRRAADRERKRLRKSAEVGGIRGTVSPKEIPPTPPKEITPSDIPPATPKGVSAPKPTPRSELGLVLSPLIADAVVAHRVKIGKPMTVRAAKLLADKFAKCPNPDAAADAMIVNGWQGFELEWMDRRQARAGPGPQRQAPMDHFKNFASEINGQAGNDGSVGGNWDDAPGIPVRAIEHHG